jgi:hypothetical protein
MRHAPHARRRHKWSSGTAEKSDGAWTTSRLKSRSRSDLHHGQRFLTSIVGCGCDFDGQPMLPPNQLSVSQDDEWPGLVGGPSSSPRLGPDG